MITNFWYHNLDDDRRALLADVDNVRVKHTRLIIRADNGEGDLLLNKTYKTHAGARAALNKAGGRWVLSVKTIY